MKMNGMVGGYVVDGGGGGYGPVNDTRYCGSGYNEAGGGDFYKHNDFCSGYA